MQQSPCIYSVLKLGTVNHPSNCRGAERGFVRACSGCQPRSRAHRQRPSWPLTPPASRWIHLNPRGAILFAPRLLKQWQTWAGKVTGSHIQPWMRNMAEKPSRGVIHSLAVPWGDQKGDAGRELALLSSQAPGKPQRPASASCSCCLPQSLEGKTWAA